MLDSDWTGTTKIKMSTFPCQGMYKKHSYASITMDHGNHSINCTPMSPQTMEQNSICHTRRHSSVTKQTISTIHSGCHWNVLILCLNGEQHSAHHLQCPCNRTVKTNSKTLQNSKQFLDYAASNSDATLTYHSSNMVLAILSNVSYLREPKAHSRMRGHFFLSGNITFPPNSGMVHNTMNRRRRRRMILCHL